MNCIKCGGDMVGDGYTLVDHCEYADEADYEFHEPDAGPVYCKYVDETETLDFKEWIEQHCFFDGFDDKGSATSFINVGTVGHIEC